MSLFCAKVFCKAILYLQFGLAFFWPKNIGEKAARKMLMKLTTEILLRKNFAFFRISESQKNMIGSNQSLTRGKNNILNEKKKYCRKNRVGKKDKSVFIPNKKNEKIKHSKK